MPFEAIIKVCNGPQAEQKVHLVDAGEATIGRAKDAQLSISEDTSLSRRHFTIRLSSEGLDLIDLGSRNGVRVNGTKVAGTVRLASKDRIEAGETFFEVRIREKGEGAVASAPAAATPQSAALNPVLKSTVQFDFSSMPAPAIALHVLHASKRPLFGVFDAAKNEKVSAMLREHRTDCRLLFGREDRLLRPVLATLPHGSELLRALVESGWGKRWGVYLSASAELDKLARHFERFVHLHGAGNEQFYFPFCEPAALLAALPALDPAQQQSFFGPVSRFVFEGERPSSAGFVAFRDGQLKAGERSLLQLLSE